MNGKQLRNSILQWAIQGKLVPQDPNDEPASVLLERIREEKARLVKEKKIKRDKNESIIYRGEDNSYYEKFADGKVVCIDEEIPFEVPESWVWVRLGGIVAMITDGTHNRPKYVEKGVPFLSVKDISSGRINFGDCKYISKEDHAILSARCSPKFGDLLITKVGSNTGIPVLVDTDIEFSLFVSVALIKFIANTLYNRYIVFLINSPLVQSQVKERTRGVGNPNWVLKDIADTIIPLPPLAEQHRIVEKIQDLLPVVEQYNSAQSKLDNLNKDIKPALCKSILQEAIQGLLVEQDPNDEPAIDLLKRVKVEKKQLVKEGKLKKSALADSIIYRGDDNKYYEQINGQLIKVEHETLFPQSWQVCRLSFICQLIDGYKQKGKQICLDAKYLRGKSDGTIVEHGRFVNKGDNIILVDGENSGEVFTVPIDGYMGSTFKQLWVSNAMDLQYVLYVIRFYKEMLRNSKKGAAIPHLNKQLFYNIIVGIPPIEEQSRIVARVNHLFQLSI